MAIVLNIESSPRKNMSASIAVSEAFLEAYLEKHPDDKVDTLNLWDAELPPFNGAVLDAKYAILRGASHTAEQATAWKKVESVIERFKSADKYVVSVPMWNFGIPYVLKHYFDLLIQPGLTFSFSPETGYTGLVTGKPVVIIGARGGAYPENTDYAALDHQMPYLKQLFGFIGFTDVSSVVVENTLSGEDTLKDAMALARKEAAGF